MLGIKQNLPSCRNLSFKELKKDEKSINRFLNQNEIKALDDASYTIEKLAGKDLKVEIKAANYFDVGHKFIISAKKKWSPGKPVKIHLPIKDDGEKYLYLDVFTGKYKKYDVVYKSVDREVSANDVIGTADVAICGALMYDNKLLNEYEKRRDSVWSGREKYQSVVKEEGLHRSMCSSYPESHGCKSFSRLFF